MVRHLRYFTEIDIDIFRNLANIYDVRLNSKLVLSQVPQWYRDQWHVSWYMHTSVPWSDWVPDRNVTSCWLDIDRSSHVFPSLNWYELPSWWTNDSQISHCFSHSFATPTYLLLVILAAMPHSYTSQESFHTCTQCMCPIEIYRCEFNHCSVTRDLCYSTPATMPPLSSSPSRTSRTSIPPITCKPLQESCWFCCQLCWASVPAANPADAYHGQPNHVSKSSIAPGCDQPNAFLKTAYAYSSSDKFYKQASHIWSCL